MCVTGFPNVHAQIYTQTISVPRPKTKEKTCEIDEYRKYYTENELVYPKTQWAAVRILLGLIRVPPHLKLPSRLSVTFKLNNNVK